MLFLPIEGTDSTDREHKTATNTIGFLPLHLNSSDTKFALDGTTQTDERRGMRKASTLVGLALFALADMAYAQEAAQETTQAAATAVVAGDAATAAAPAAAGKVATLPSASVPAPAPTTVQPADHVAAVLVSEPAASQRKFQVGLAFLPMGLGRWTNSPNPITTVTTDAAFAYGLGLSVGYQVLPYLVAGLAPQAIFNVKEKAPTVPVDAVREYDLMARVAGEIQIVEGTKLYAELLPGYSLITTNSSPKGFVVAFGVGATMQMTDRIFVNVGGGYQIGFQKWASGANTLTTSTKYLRVALGAGVRL